VLIGTVVLREWVLYFGGNDGLLPMNRRLF